MASYVFAFVSVCLIIYHSNSFENVYDDGPYLYMNWYRVIHPDLENVRITSNQDQEQDLNEELLKKLTLELSHSITELHKEVMADEATKKKLLLDKLSQSGHFGTTFVKPDVALEPEKVADETQVKKVSKREASQPMISPNDNPLLFRISDVNIVKDEEEFRFLPEQ